MKNSYKLHRKKSLFTRLEQRLQFKDYLPQGFPRHYLFRLLFLFVMGTLYVGNTHYHERMVRKIAQLEQETAVLRTEYTSLQADYMLNNQRSEVAKKAAALGLFEASSPPLKIKSK